MVPCLGLHRLPEVAASLLELDAVTVASLTDPQEAVDLLLQGPLAAWLAAREQAGGGQPQASCPGDIRTDVLSSSPDAGSPSIS